MTRYLTLFAFFLTSTFLSSQTKKNSSVTYKSPNDSSEAVISYKNLTIKRMDLSKMRKLIDSALIEGGEDFLSHQVYTIFSLTKDDLKEIRQTVGGIRNWEVYIDVTNFRETNSTYYIWLISKTKK